MNRSLMLSLVCCGFLTAGAEEVPIPEGRRLRDIVAERYDENVYIGGTTGYRTWGKGAGRLLNREFHTITPDNDFKQHRVHPRPGVWDWEVSDGWIDHAREHGHLIRLHAPISPQCSEWARMDERTPEELKQNLEAYMTAICQRYNGEPTVRWLDVVNEVLLPNGSWHGPKPGVARWENPWPLIGVETDIPDQFPLLQEQGVPLYIPMAFAIATREAPDIKLIINQHKYIGEPATAKLKELVLYLRSRGYRVDGIGWQAHVKNLEPWRDPNGQKPRQLSELIQWAHAHDLEFHVTEKNLHVPKKGKRNPELYAAVYDTILRTVLRHRDTGVVGWNVWTLSETGHWANPRIQLLGMWDPDLKPNPSYYAVQAVLEEAP